jgi:hypothetical protein
MKSTRVRVGDDFLHNESGELWTVTAIRGALPEDMPRWIDDRLAPAYLHFDTKRKADGETAVCVIGRGQDVVVERVNR